MSLAHWSRRVDALAQFKVRDVASPALDHAARHHLFDVLRAKDGEEIVVTDGVGRWAFAGVNAGAILRSSDVGLDEPLADTVLYLAPLKGDRSEWAIAKITELGVARVVPLLSERLATRFKGETRDKILNRWRRVSDEAAAQSRRTYDLLIDAPVSVADVPVHVAVCDFDGDGDWSGVRAVAIGPEGGFAPGEWSDDRRRLGLGPSVLRGETAAVVAGALLAFGTGKWGFSLRGAADE
ncbi:MAG: 16S rRNA (uracil(1498)-N(3))-methyltransferase [Acidobacteriota bacterium]|nr:16S rRNA (uracil(1498)-N(3))-methyltransferase [Acidobacteriota bacterium]